jgi:acyl carrier protein
VSTSGRYDLDLRIRNVVADVLGVEHEDLQPEVSLADDLAADSLDLVEIALGLEVELGIRIPEDVLEGVRTYAELVQATLALTRERRGTVKHEVEPMRVSARVLPNPRAGEFVLERVGWLTPYTTETILEDALHAGRGARLVVTVPWDVSAAGLARVQRSFAGLHPRGIEVCVRRGVPGPFQPRATGAKDAAA